LDGRRWSTMGRFNVESFYSLTYSAVKLFSSTPMPWPNSLSRHPPFLLCCWRTMVSSFIILHCMPSPWWRSLSSSVRCTWALSHPVFKAKTRCSSYVCPGSSCHTYGQNVSTEYQCLYYIVSYYKNLLQVQNGLNSGMDPILP
jgi:hypothetical protein